MPTDAVARALRSNATLLMDRDLLLLRKPPQVRFLQPAKASVMAASATCIKHWGATMAPTAVFYYVAFEFLHLAKTTFAVFEAFESRSGKDLDATPTATGTTTLLDSVLDDNLPQQSRNKGSIQ